MKRRREQAVFAIHVAFALVSVILLALNMVKAEAALTNRQMLTLIVTASKSYPVKATGENGRGKTERPNGPHSI
jgi:hypothetical protein